MPLVAGEREDRARGGSADARQRCDLLEARRERTGMQIAHTLRGAVQVAGAGVIAEAGPEVQHFVDGRVGQRHDVRKARNETLEVRDHRRDLRLLQHDLRHPHAVRRTVALPRQVVATAA